MRNTVYLLACLCLVFASNAAYSAGGKQGYKSKQQHQARYQNHADSDSNSDSHSNSDSDSDSRSNGKKAKRGLKRKAIKELRRAGVDKYVGEFSPALSLPVLEDPSWIKHTFDPADGAGPICIAGTPFSMFTRERDPNKVLIMLQGGGACWQGLYSCNVLAEAQEPPAPAPIGIWDDETGANPLEGWSVVYMPYCDGSVFSGDNDVFDPAFGEAINVPQIVVRFHRGLRNLTAGMDVAKSLFPDAENVMVAGSSAGGVGAAGFAPFLARLAFGNRSNLTVFNDAGPVAVNLADTAAVQARAWDWNFGQFYPKSCNDCSDMGQGTAIIKWRLKNDRTIRESFYSTDYDETNRFFMNLLFDPIGYRNLIIDAHGEINDLFPERYKRFIQAGKISHTALQTFDFYSSANGVPLPIWLNDFIENGETWVDIVEDFLPPPSL